MRADCYTRKRVRPEEITTQELDLMTRCFSYNLATRYFKVTLTPLMEYMKNHYPERHEKIVANGVLLKHKKNSRYLLEQENAK